MNYKPFCALAFCLALTLTTPAHADKYSEDFNAPAKSDGTVTGWTLCPGFSEAPGALAFDGNAGGHSVWNAVPIGKSMTFTAKITPGEALGKDWDIAGIEIYFDDQNFWRLALCQAPDGDLKKVHYADFNECLEGVWGANSAQGTKLTSNNAVNNPGWKPDDTILFKIILTPGQIQGQVIQGDVVKYDCTCKFDAPAVKKGRPALFGGGLKARFSELRVDAP